MLWREETATHDNEWWRRPGQCSLARRRRRLPPLPEGPFRRALGRWVATAIDLTPRLDLSLQPLVDGGSGGASDGQLKILCQCPSSCVRLLALLCAIHSASRSGGATAGENRAGFGHGRRCDVFDVVSFSMHRFCSPCHLARASLRETLDLSLLPDRMMVAPLVSFPSRRHRFEHTLVGGPTRRSGVSSTASTT